MDVVNCPRCGGAMTPGTLRLREELWRQLTLWGMSWLAATLVTATRKRKVMAPGETRQAFACAKCQWVAMRRPVL